MISFFQFLIREASYKGNLGFIELYQFLERAKKENPELYKKVQALIAKRDNDSSQEVWRIVQDSLGVKLVGKEFGN